MRERKSKKLINFCSLLLSSPTLRHTASSREKKVKENEKFIYRVFGVNLFIFPSFICFYFTTLPLNKHQSRTAILLCSLIIVKPDYKMKVLFSPFGCITWKVNDNWIRNKKMSEHTLRKETGWADESKNHEKRT